MCLSFSLLNFNFTNSEQSLSWFFFSLCFFPCHCHTRPAHTASETSFWRLAFLPLLVWSFRRNYWTFWWAFRYIYWKHSRNSFKHKTLLISSLWSAQSQSLQIPDSKFEQNMDVPISFPRSPHCISNYYSQFNWKNHYEAMYELINCK